MKRTVALLLASLLVAACKSGSETGNTTGDAGSAALTAVTVSSGGGTHVFRVERAVSEAEQAQGLMFRTDIPADGGMLFAPYPADGSGPAAASFWMKNTPSPLDIIFIRADHTIAHIADNTTPFSTTSVSSGEPVAAVLEINGGRAGELGIAEGDTVTWRK